MKLQSPIQKSLISDLIIPALIRKNYKVFDKNNYNLNLVAIRKEVQVINEFNDDFYVFWRESLKRESWEGEVFNITTVPGKHWLQNLLNPKGTAILVPGQYKSCYKLGKHRGFDALVQVGEVKVFRDKNKDLSLNLIESSVISGFFGINIHRASKGITRHIDKWSAGCQVFKNSFDFELFIELCKKSSKIYGNSFTYTLLNERDLTNE